MYHKISAHQLIVGHINDQLIIQAHLWFWGYLTEVISQIVSCFLTPIIFKIDLDLTLIFAFPQLPV